MDNVNFEAKTNWVQNETVYPADANRWEKGIKDCADLVNNHNTTQIPALENNKVNKSGDTMTGELKVPTPSESENSTVVPNTAWVKKFLNDELGKVNPLLTSLWSDHLLNNISWLRADTFSWHSGDVYTAAYNKLAEELESTQGIYQVETINGITIKTQISSNGFKLIKTNVADGAERLQAVENLYNSTGIAWYYVIDTDNRRFKLPRTKWGFTGLRTSVGDYVAPGLPNITGAAWINAPWSEVISQNGALSTTTRYRKFVSGEVDQTIVDGIYLNASASNAIYGASDTVQPPATQMYLYFYAGNFTQEAIEQTAGINSETLNRKIDLPAGKNQAEVDYVVDRYADNNGNWYRVYKSGWVEQGGHHEGVPNQENWAISFLKPMANTHYTVSTSRSLMPVDIEHSRHEVVVADTISTTGFSIRNSRFDGSSTEHLGIWYRVCGQGAN